MNFLRNVNFSNTGVPSNVNFLIFFDEKVGFFFDENLIKLANAKFDEKFVFFDKKKDFFLSKF